MKINKSTGEIINPPIEQGEPRVFLRTPYNYDTDEATAETALVCETETKTQQQFRDDTDINTIIARFGIEAQVPADFKWPEPNEFIDTFDFQSSMNIIRKAQEQFMSLPADVRSRFDNDPQKFMQFFNNPRNQEEAIEMGLAQRIPEPTPTPTPEIKTEKEN